MGNTANDYDASAYHYLFELYTIEHELFWNRAYIYTLIETTLFTVYVAAMQFKVSAILIAIFLTVGVAFPLYTLFVALRDRAEVLDLEQALSTIEPKALGPYRIFAKKLDKRKNDKFNFSSIEIIGLFIILLVIWFVLAGLHLFGQESRLFPGLI